MKILVVAPVKTGVKPELYNCKESFALLAYIASECFKKYPDVELSFHNCWDDFDYPESDFVISIAYHVCAGIDVMRHIREETRCKKLVSLLEVPTNGVDKAYTFCGKYCFPNSQNFNPPYYEPIYPRFPSIQKNNKILLDHQWDSYVGTGKDITRKIQKWTEELTGSYEIYRLIHPKNSDIVNFPSWVKPFYTTNFYEYINELSKFTYFIVTHMESYGYSIIDSVMTMTEVFAPVGFLNQSNLAEFFEIEQFQGKEEFLRLIRRPFSTERLHERKRAMTPFDEIIKTIYNDFVEWSKK